MNESPRWILHVDMDAFYASVEVLDNPALRGKPVIVAGLSARGVVCSASYEARKFRIRAAMPTQQARVLCKHGVFLRPRMERYRQVSRQVFAILREFSDCVEPVSVDEGYCDITNRVSQTESPEELAQCLKQRIREEIGLTASVGIAPNKFLAKIASDLQKPDGLVIIRPEEIEIFLPDLPVGRIPGIGPVTQHKLQQQGIKKVGELRRLSREELEHLFGKAGGRLYEFARGIDNRPVVAHRPAKSFSREETFETDTGDLERIRRVLRVQSESLAQCLAVKRLRAQCVTLKIKYADFRQVTRQRRLDDGFDDAETIFQTAALLLKRTEAGRRLVRLVGTGVSELLGETPAGQMELFE
ncbi:MAG: DNA polymerase IV [Candidatus Sumerlaeia bacterium]|nr:DNA polymerase IV [Candidatus Sumerlaeia bacterium]